MHSINDFISKLENPIRLSELNPPETLKRIGISNTDIICDIGAGSGVFTIPSAKLTDNFVYAVDINEELLGVIGDKAKHEGLSNIKLIKTDGVSISVPDDLADVALLVTVLHEISDKSMFLSNIKRILKQSGRLTVIEFTKEASLGPPALIRISAEELDLIMKNNDLNLIESFNLSENLYCSVYNK